MTVLIDPPLWPAHGTVFSHLVSDTSLLELRAFARAAGVPDRAFDLDHYDVAAFRHDDLIAAGATPVDGIELARRLSASNLRVRGAERAGSKHAPMLARWDTLLPTAELPTPPALPHALDRPSGEASNVRSAGRSRARRSDDVAAWHAVGEALDDRWREPHRTYHTAFHLFTALNALDSLLDNAAASSSPVPDDVAWRARVALWFHDAVHDGTTPADEEASAALVHDLLGPLTARQPSAVVMTLPPGPRSRPDAPGEGGSSAGNPFLRREDVEELARLVMVTADHAPEPADLAGCLVSDADLAILGAAPATYARYTHQVRAEYAHVPDDLFRRGRAQVLETLLAGTDLFRTPWARTRWQPQATSNLTAELRDLARDA